MVPRHIALIAPCYNEGNVAVRFIQEIEDVIRDTTFVWTVVMVDDASSDDTLVRLRAYSPSAGNVRLRPISLPYNMGHQEAIYQGLLYASTTEATRFVVMDSDGEDDPSALLELSGISDSSIVFVSRGKRSEPLPFKIGYWLYRSMFKAIAGRTISFGNYSMIDRSVLRVVIERSFVHYAAFLSRQRTTIRMITYDRRKRIDGRSKMSFQSLSMHAFRSLIEYSEDMLNMFLKVFLLLTLIFTCSILAIISIKLFTAYAVPGWASTLSLSLFNSMLVCLGFFMIGLIMLNQSARRSRAGRHFYKTSGTDPEE